MNCTRIYSMMVMLCLFFCTQQLVAQCDVTLSATVTPVRCFGENNGAIDLSVGGGTAPYNYIWSDGQTDEDPSGLASGMYFVTVTDQLGCVANLARSISEPSQLLATALGATIRCTDPVVSIPVAAIGGNSSYQYFWSNGETGNAFQTNVAGTYTVTVMDAKGCTASAQALVGVDTFPPLADAGPDRLLNCQTPEVKIGGIGSSSGTNYSYIWSGPGITNGVGGNSTQQFPTVSLPGTYTLFVFNDINGCQQVDVMQVGGQAPPVANAGADTGLPCGGGQVTLNGAGSPIGPQYTYQWSTTDGNIVSGASTLNPLVDEPGVYRLNLTDGNNGCMVFDEVKVFPGPVVPVQDQFVLDVSCTGQLGIAGVDMTQGTGPYTYLWSNGSTDASIVNVLAGTYTVTVGDATGCNYYAELLVKANSTLTLNALTTNPACGVGNNGAIDLQLTGIFGPFEFAWSTGAPTEDLNNLDAGTYTVTVTYALGSCTENLSVTLTNASSMTLGTVVVNANSCPATLGAIDLSVTAGVPPLDFAWNTGDGTEDINNLPAGVYEVTVTDATGCSKTTSATVGDDFNLGATLVPTSATCMGGNPCNGWIDVTVTGGVAPFDYFWSTGPSTQDILNLCPGTYTVTIMDANGCTKSFSTVVGQSGAAIVATAVPTNTSCGLNNGSIDLTVFGGGGNYIYSWSNNTFSQDLTNLAPGTYTVTVVETGQCSQTASATIFQAPDMSLSTSVLPDECGANGGLIDVTVNGGVGPFIYDWSNGSTFQINLNLLPGTYTVTVTDVGGCTETTSATIVASSGLTINSVVTDASCNLNDGSIDIDIVGGITPFSYLWSDGSTQEDRVGLGQGTYTVTVTSGASCTETASMQVGQSAALSLSASISASNSCILGNGAIDLTVTPPGTYTYNWSNGVTTEDLNGLITGSYTVTVFDGFGCSEEATYFVSDNSVAPILSAIPTASNCDFSNGAIDLSVSGGIGPFTYLWSNGVTSQDLVNLVAGQYGVTVTGSNGCTSFISVQIDNINPVISLSAIITANTACLSSNGSIDLSVSPLGTYSYLWSTSETSEDINGLLPGTYAVTVSFGGTCTAQETFDVGSNTNTLVLSTLVTDASCTGSDGGIDLSVTGGAPNYIYNWGNGATTEDISGLTAGTYTVTVVDSNGCLETASATVGTISGMVTTTTVSNVLCNGGNNGAIDLTVTGGTPGYTYQWATGAGTQDISGLVAGVYTVTVTDANGCTKTTTATINEPSAIALTTIISQVSCNGGSNGSIDLTVSGGVSPYTYQWNPSVGNSQDLTNLAAGVYCVTVTDVNGCTATSCEVVSQPALLVFDIVSLSNDCTSETITGPNLPGFTYLWTGPNNFNSTTAAITVSVPGLYSLTITDINGCSATEDYTVNLIAGGACGVLKGRVGHDEDENCSLDTGEPGLAGWIVRAEGANDTLYGVTDAQGRYFVGVPIGTYTMQVFVPNGLWTVCPGGAAVSLNALGDTIAGGDFPVKSAFVCPALSVSMGTNKLRRCFAGNFYHVEYCNLGTEAAQDAYVTVALDPFLTPLSSSVPYTDLGSNVLQFDLGTLDIGECGDFSIEVFVNCNAVLGQTHCSQASIYPDSLCMPPNANWSGASLQVSSICNPDSLRFVIKNIGNGNMGNTQEYIVVEDGVMFRQGTLAPLAQNETMEIVVPANGSTWRVEVGQEAYHPYPAPVGLSVEGCATSSSFSTGFVNQFTTQDEPSSTDIDCTTNIGSFDPNDKHSYPVGYGADHYIRPGTDIEYLIRFQNTGTDTAFTVEIVDTLSAWLDPTTIRFGASSHPYQYDLNGQGVVHFLFEDILLPDSFTNEVASHGFAKFSIKPRLDAPLQSRIENTAAIYFDFNDPIFTNTTWHRLGENFITVGLWQPERASTRIVAMPNPFNEQTILEVTGLSDVGGLRLEVFDLQGHVVRIMESENAQFQLRKGDWPSGIYLFKVTQGGRSIGKGKLMVE